MSACKGCGQSQATCSALQSRGKRGRQCCGDCSHKQLSSLEPVRSVINYDLLRVDVFESRPETISEISEASGVDRSVLSRFCGGDSTRGLSLEHFAKLVIWLGFPADRYILRPVKPGSES